MSRSIERKCRNCIHFQFGEVPKQVYDSVIYSRPNGACWLTFPKGYAGRRTPPHWKNDNEMACFQFEPKDTEQMTLWDAEEGADDWGEAYPRGNGKSEKSLFEFIEWVESLEEMPVDYVEVRKQLRKNRKECAGRIAELLKDKGTFWIVSEEGAEDGKAEV